MLTQDVRVQYSGFHPSDRTDQRLQSWAHEIQEQAPSESNIKAIYTKQGREYQGELRVTSRAGQFYAIARGVNLYSVARDAMKRMRRQLEKWRTVRFHKHADVVAQIPTDQSTEQPAQTTAV